MCVCSVCSALRACGAYNPTELKRLQHGQKITNMLENQVQQHMVLKKPCCKFFGLFQGNFFAFSKALEPCMLSAADYMHIYVQCLFQGKSLFQGKNLFQGKAFPRHDYPFPRPEAFFKATNLLRPEAFFKAINLFQGQKPFSRPPVFQDHKPFSRPPAFFKATSFFQGQKPFSRPPAFFKAISLFQGHKPFSRPPAFFKATSLFQGHQPFSRPPAFFKAISGFLPFRHLFQGWRIERDSPSN